MAVVLQLKENTARSVLRYPGGKFRAVDIIRNLIPSNITQICSPFLGGGSVEIACARNNITVYGYDIFTPLVEFWQCLLSNPERLANTVKEHYPLSKDDFYNLQKTQRHHKSKYRRAAIFYVINRSSFSGSTLSGGMSPGHLRFNDASIQRLREFKINNFNVKRLDFRKSISRHRQDLLYLDPPYMIDQTLYGVNGDAHKNFDHKALATILKKRDKWILSYNNSPEIHQLYEGYVFLYPDWKYGMSSIKKSREVLILSHDIAEYNDIHGKSHRCPRN